MSYRASPALENYITESAPAHYAVLPHEAPSTYEELVSAIAKTTPTGPIPVLCTLASDMTIYSSPYVNDALRAGHDLVHYNESLTFTLHDELEVVRQQILDAESMAVEYDLTEEDIEVLFIDLAGQRMYYELHGKYVVEQDRFMQSCLSNGLGFTLGTMEVF